MRYEFGQIDRKHKELLKQFTLLADHVHETLNGSNNTKRSSKKRRNSKTSHLSRYSRSRYSRSRHSKQSKHESPEDDHESKKTLASKQSKEHQLQVPVITIDNANSSRNILPMPNYEDRAKT